MGLFEDTYEVIPIIHVLSKLGLLFSMLPLVLTLMSYFFLDSAFPVFVCTAPVTTTGPYIAWVLTLRSNRKLRPRDGFTLVLMLWLAFAAVVTIPIYFHIPNMSFTDALLETMSGLTTTGPTVMNSLDTLTPLVNFWWYMPSWLSGMRIIALVVAVLLMLGVGDTQLFEAEVPGMDKESKMAPRISQVAKKLWFSYTLMTTTALVLLHLAGMSWFNAPCHAMSAVALGGFSTYDDNIAYFNSVSIEWVPTFFTVFGATNLVSHFVAFANRSLKVYRYDEECRVLLSMPSGSIVVLVVYLWYMEYYLLLADPIRFTALDFASAGLASGPPDADFAKRPLMISLQMFLLSNVLASSGSMGGGIKNVRGLMMFKFSVREMMILLHLHAVCTAKVNGRSIQERMALAMMSFISIHFIAVMIFSFLMMAAGLDFFSAPTAIIACITNAGPGLGVAGPEHNHAVLNDVQEWSYTTVMLLGWLEISAVLILFTLAYWKK